MAATDRAPTPSTAASPSFRHDVGFYSSDEEFRDLIVPFVQAGLEAGEAVIFGYDPHKVALLQSWLPASDAISYVSETNPYGSPALALDGWRQLVEARTAKGYPRVRIAGNVPHPGYGVPYAGWDRYEMAIDRAWGSTRAWARCLYDTRLAPAAVVERARRIHHHLADPADGGAPDLIENPDFREVRSLGECLLPSLDAVGGQEPLVELVDPPPAQARTLVGQLAGDRIGQALIDDLCLATSEVVTNATVHGTPPVVVRVWAATGKVTVQIRDCGPGPADPLIGLLSPPSATVESGRGLGIVQRLALATLLHASDDGFAVQLLAEDSRVSGESVG